MTDVSIPPNTATVKRCAKCGFECAIEDAAQFFYCTLRRGKPCFASYCKPCQRAYQVERRKQNPERVREIARRSYWNNHDERREKLRLYRLKNIDRDRLRIKRWRQNNPEKEHAIHKRYYEKNKDKLTAYQRAYEKSNRHLGALKNARRRAKRNELPINWTREDRWGAVEHFNYTCAYCGSQFHDLFGDVAIHFDHYIPLSAGGGTTFDNMLPTCKPCNLSKSSLDPVFWLTRKFGKRKANKIQKRIIEYFEELRREK